MSNKWIQAQDFFLAGSGASIGDTTITLKSFETIQGDPITTSDIGATGYMTLEPGNGTQEESISFTGVTQNANGTATLTGVKTVLTVYPYTETSGLAITHPGSSLAILTNTAGFYNQFPARDNAETITGYWNVPDPVDNTNIANREWVLTVVNGGPVSMNQLIIAATADTTISAGNLVYLKSSNSRWALASSAASATADDVILGIAMGAGTSGNAITGGVMLQGSYTSFVGLTPNSVYYLSTGGAISTSAGTVSVAVGIATSATVLAFAPRYTTQVTTDQFAALTGTTGTPSSTNPFMTRTDNRAGLQKSVTAGATINGASLPVPVYQDTTSNKYLACDGNDTTKLKFQGFAISNSTDTNPIDIQTGGIVSGFTGLDEGVAYFLSDTVGTIQNTPGTYPVMVGVAISTTELLIQKGRRYMSGTTTFTATTTTAITTGFRPMVVRVNASLATGDSIATSNGGWTVGGGNGCVYAAIDASDVAQAAGNATTAWSLRNNADGLIHSGSVTLPTTTGFTLDNTETSGSTTANIFWEAIGDF